MTEKTYIVAESVVHYDFDEMCRLTAVKGEFLLELVDHGVLEPHGQTQPEWRFTQEQLRLCRRALSLRRDLDVNVPGIGVTLQLLQEVEQLRKKVALLEQGWHG
ncbi:TPA: chaperone modulatory protein CbpM [Candidatus Micrarchaeota archaeon]|nr:chaperone modulatory protein CbpM [Candidatus Micrarchaeota archaeon]